MGKIPRLCDLKGAALSILVFLSMHGERSWSVTELCGDESTGYSDKPVKAGLLRLMELGLITEVRKNRYELNGGSVFQLPLSWDERIEAFGETPKITGDSPRSFGVSPNRELEDRVAALEAAVFRGLPVSEAGDSPIIFGDSPKVGGDAARWPRPGARDEMHAGSFAEKFGISPNDSGDSPMFEADGNGEVDAAGTGPESREEIYSGNFPGKIGESPNESGETPKDVNAAGTGPAGSSPREEMDFGDIPGNVGESPKKSGETPKGLINNINNTCEKKVSKYVDNKDIYLLNGTNKERKEFNPETQLGGQSPVPASRQQVTGPVLLPEPEAAEMIHWNAAMEQMQVLMDRGSFTTMLKDAAVLGYEDGHYTIGVKNQMVRDWVDQRCRATIEKVLNGMSGNAGVVQSVSFVVSEVSETQLGGQSPVPASRQQAAGPVLLPESVDPEENMLVGICNAYLLDPTGPEYSADQLAELVGMHPDPDVLRFVLPRLSGFEAVKGWCAADRKTAKRWLLTHFKIVGTAVDKLSADDRVSFGLIVSVCLDQGIEDLNGVETKKVDQMRGKAIWLINKLSKEAMPK